MNALREAEEILRRAGGLGDDEIDLAETALALAALETPEPGFERYRHHLSLLARDTADVAAPEAETALEPRIAALRKVLVERYEYAGDRETYDDLQNANLMRVIDRRLGLPVALGILYIHAARAQDWPIAGLNFPGHFLLRIDCAGQRAIVDPFSGLSELGAGELRQFVKALSGDEAELAPDHYEALTNRGILLRLQNNRKLRLLKEKRGEEAIQVIEGMLMFAPGESQLWREAGLLHAHVGNLRAAVVTLEQFLDLNTDPGKRDEVAGLLHELRRQIN